jgi:hypothetical protein
LEPLHQALRAALDPPMLAKIIEAAEMEATGAIALRQREKRILEAVEPFIERGNHFHKVARQFEPDHAATSTSMEPRQSALLVATLALPRFEALFPKPWPQTARKVLPSDSPGTSGTAVWAPVLAWSLLRGLPLDGVSVFDSLRLRHALAHTFQELGMSGEDGWRGAARVRFLLHRADPLLPWLSQEEWRNSDVQWLTGTHESEGVRYFNQESHEELLWWIQMPALVAAAPSEQRVTAQRCAAAVSQGAQAAKAAGYRLDALLEAESHSGRKGTTTGAPDSSGLVTAAAQKEPKAGSTKSSRSSNQVRAKAKSSTPQDGAGAARSTEKVSAEKAKKTTKKPSPSKRKP